IYECSKKITMYKKTITSSFLFLLCIISSINAMDSKIVLPLTIIGSFAMLVALLRSVPPSTPTRQFDGLWVQTSDNHVMYLAPDVVNQCEMLKIGAILYPNTSEKKPLSKIRFTQKQMITFINALENCSSIDHEKDLNTLMTVAEKCKAYMLYAHCIS